MMAWVLDSQNGCEAISTTAGSSLSGLRNHVGGPCDELACDK
jgi:hypothetical protein